MFAFALFTSALSGAFLEDPSIDKSLLSRPGGFDNTYIHNYVDENGISRMKRCNFTNFYVSQIEKGVIPTTVIFGVPDASYKRRPKVSSLRGINNVPVNVTETGLWTYPPTYGHPEQKEWHTNPRPHLLFFMGGIGEWRSGDGTRVKFFPGDVQLADDVLAKDGIGHTTRALGKHQMVHLNWELDAPNTKGQPCWLH